MSDVLIRSFVNAEGAQINAPAPQAAEPRFAPESVDQLRRIAIEYMYAMAKVVWTANQRFDYSFNDASLIYEPGRTYVGMIYNNCRNGLEAFLDALDENGVYKLADNGWDTAPGNSCATSVRHAWQMISPDVEFLYSVDMMPCYDYSHVLPVGDIDWTLYDGKHTTNSILNNTDKNVILEAYAQAQPADGFMRYLDEKGGHALMVTLPPVVVRDDQGRIDPEQSFVFLTDQTNKINTLRSYPSTWKIDRQVSFEKAYTDGWLPVTTKELRQGNAPAPVFEVLRQPTAGSLEAGYPVDTVVRCNYCLVTLQAKLWDENAGGILLREAELHPYKREVPLNALAESLHMDDLPAGQYRLSVNARVGLGGAQLFEIVFSKV